MSPPMPSGCAGSPVLPAPGDWRSSCSTAAPSSSTAATRIQVRKQVDTTLFTPQHLVDEPPAEWLEKELRHGEVLGYDPWLLTADQIEQVRKAACAKAGAKLVAVDSNPIDAHLDAIARLARAIRSPSSRRSSPAARLRTSSPMSRTALAKAGADAVVLTQPDSVAWVFNIRGRDVAYTPVGADLCHPAPGGRGRAVRRRRPGFPRMCIAHLSGSRRHSRPAELDAALSALGARKGERARSIPTGRPNASAPCFRPTGAEIVTGKDPCVLPKARKNAIEQEGARAAHRRDGVAMARFLCWLEIAAAERRSSTKSPSPKSSPSSAAKPACSRISRSLRSPAPVPMPPIPHYRVTRQSNRQLDSERPLSDRFRRPVSGRHHRHHPHRHRRRADRAR